MVGLMRVVVVVVRVGITVVVVVFCVGVMVFMVVQMVVMLEIVVVIVFARCATKVHNDKKFLGRCDLTTSIEIQFK